MIHHIINQQGICDSEEAEAWCNFLIEGLDGEEE